MPAGLSLSYFAYLVVSYLLVQAGFMPLVLSLVFHLVFFLIYCSVYYRSKKLILRAFASAWSMFVYMALMSVFGYFQDQGSMNNLGTLGVFLIVATINYYYLLNQKGYNPQIHYAATDANVK
jgi:hypothetical protein